MLFTAGVAVLPPFVYLGVGQDVEPRDGAALGILAIVAPLTVLALALHGLRWWRDEIVVHERGCVQRSAGVEVAFAWDDVVASRTEPVRSVLSTSDLARFGRLCLELRGGARLQVPPDYGFFGPSASLPAVPMMREAILRGLVTTARASFASGAPIVFGDITAHPERGLLRGAQALGWSDIGRVDIDQDDLMTIRRADEAPWAVVDGTSVRDFDLFHLLVMSRGRLPDEEA